MSKSAVAKASTIVYFGPSDTLYCRVGSIDANETVEVHAKNLTIITSPIRQALRKNADLFQLDRL